MPFTDEIKVKDHRYSNVQDKKKFSAGNNFSKWLIILLPLSFALISGFLMAEHLPLGFGLLALIIGVAVITLCILNAEIGLYIILLYSFFISFFNRLVFENILPIGVFSDILVGVTFFGFIIRREKIGIETKRLVSTRVGSLLVAIYVYTFFEIFNFAGLSITGFIPVVRKILSVFLLLLICYIIFSDKRKIERFVNILFISCVLVALYACIQEWHGFFNFELDWLRMDPRRFRMTFVNGGARRMSVFPDALSLSIVMSIGVVFYAALAMMEEKLVKRITFFSGVALMLAAMSYSLIRTANVMFVAGLVLFFLMAINQKRIRIFAVIGLAILLVLPFLPFGGFNQDSQFVQTLRGGTKDPSYLVREKNRKSIQPYIYVHPFGGGLSTTGDEGLTYHPNHPLAGFPPDSGYLKKALELGWIGFIIFLVLYFSVIKTGISGYFSAKGSREKTLFAACTAALFCFYVGDFAQVAIGQITDVVIYYPLISIILRLTEFTQISQTQPQIV